MSKPRVAVVYGGKSTEHEVSLQSAYGITANINLDKYHVFYIYVDKQGHWFEHTESEFNQVRSGKNAHGKALYVQLGLGKQSLRRLDDNSAFPVDVIFPIVHGNFGEDGCLQGLLRMAEIPFVGAGVLGSAVGMDKEVAKRLLDHAAIANAKYLTVYEYDDPPDYQQASTQLGTIMFVKPAAQGSSVGISKVKGPDGWQAALDHAFQFDDKILVEEFIDGREVEVSVLGNSTVEASLPGEIIPNADFYSYDAKYMDADGAKLVIPARLPDAVMARMRELAIKTYRTLGCEGMTRVDFFVCPDNRLVINEVNTLPGFTPISMYPKLWQASGLPMLDLTDRLIELAIDRFDRQARKQRSIKI